MNIIKMDTHCNGVTARNLLLAGRSRKPGFGGIHGGERGLISLSMMPLMLPCLTWTGNFLPWWMTGSGLRV